MPYCVSRSVKWKPLSRDRIEILVSNLQNENSIIIKYYKKLSKLNQLQDERTNPLRVVTRVEVSPMWRRMLS